MKKLLLIKRWQSLAIETIIAPTKRRPGEAYSRGAKTVIDIIRNYVKYQLIRRNSQKILGMNTRMTKINRFFCRILKLLEKDDRFAVLWQFFTIPARKKIKMLGDLRVVIQKIQLRYGRECSIQEVVKAV